MPIKIDDLLVTATAHFASDLHLKVGSFPVMRIGGELYPVAEAPRLAPGRHARHGVFDDVESAEAETERSLGS